MAKTCVNCGNEISLLGKSFKLKNEKVEFCNVCGKKVEKLLWDVLYVTQKTADQIGEDFDEAISHAVLNRKSARCITREFNALYLDQYPHNSVIRKFSGDFDFAFQTLKAAVCEIEGEYGVPGSYCVTRVGDVSAVTFVVDKSTSVVADSYSVLTVQLLHRENEATVISSGEGEGFGSAAKIDRKFWSIIGKNNPGLDITFIRKPELISI